jgi:hypothetical protein
MHIKKNIVKPLQMNKKELDQSIKTSILTASVATSIAVVLLEYTTIGKWLPWSNPNIMDVMNVSTKKDLSTSAAKLNKLIDSVKQDEAQTDASLERTNRIAKNRQEISKIFLEMANILNLDLANIIKKDPRISGSTKDLIESLRASAKTAPELNSQLAKFEI